MGASRCNFRSEGGSRCGVGCAEGGNEEKNVVVGVWCDHVRVDTLVGNRERPCSCVEICPPLAGPSYEEYEDCDEEPFVEASMGTRDIALLFLASFPFTLDDLPSTRAADIGGYRAKLFHHCCERFIVTAAERTIRRRYCLMLRGVGS